MKGIEIFKMKDKNESFHKKKGLLFDMPFRLAIVGRSQLSGKTSLCGSLLLQSDERLYKNEFEGYNMYIFSPSANTDYKLKTIIEEKEIPPENVFTDFNEEEIDALYELLKDEYNENVDAGIKPEQKLFYFDDMSYGGNFKKKMNGIMSKIFMNGRHILLNSLVTSQKYSDIPTSIRENLSGAIFFSGTDRQLELIMDDHNIFDKKTFRKMYREVTSEPHSFLVVNYSNPNESRYLNKQFLAIGKCGKVKNKDCACK
tara:strand:- start:111 stop:881 length:771 start_codon:yes stop_codon:yes gene_type:complete